MNEQLRQTCKLTGARWSAWLRHTGKDWRVEAQSGLNKARLKELLAFLHQPDTAAWLAAGLSRGRTRSRTAGKSATALACERVYSFGNPLTQCILLVGATELSSQAQGFFHILSQSQIAAPPANTPCGTIPVPDQGELTLSSSYYGVEFNIPYLLSWILNSLVKKIPGQAAFLALHAGEAFRVEAVYQYDPHVQGTVISITNQPVLITAIQRGQGQILNLSESVPDFLFSAWLPQSPRSALVQPVVFSQRVIALIVYVAYSPTAFSTLDLHQSALLGERIAHAIENILAFGEAERFLQQLSLLSELASAAAGSTNTDEVARRAAHRLRRVFRTDLAAVMLLSDEENMLREYGMEMEGRPPIMLPVASSLAGYVVESGVPVRVGDLRQTQRYIYKDLTARSFLGVPLKYRGRIIGALIIESPNLNAFTGQDEQLLVVIASQLSGLLENMRLYGETQERARNLDLIHKVVEHIAGLTDRETIAQATVEMMASYFNYEFIAVLVADDRRENLVLLGSGGSEAAKLPARASFTIEKGICGRVFKSGQLFYANDAAQDSAYFTLSDWQAGSELCIPLMDGDRVFGLLNMERLARNSFSSAEIRLTSSLAGILSSVLMSAWRYQELQTNLSHLQAARETALEIGSKLELNTLFQRVLHRVRELTQSSGVALGLVNTATETVHLAVAEGPAPLPIGQVIPFKEGIMGQVAALGKPMNIPNYDTWAKRLDIIGHVFTTALCVPLVWREQVMGVLLVMDDKPGRTFGDSETQILQLLAPQIAVSIRNARLFQELADSLEAQRVTENRLELSERLATIGKMAAGLAHEINNPLTTITGFLSLTLGEISPDEQQYEELGLALEEALRARQIVRGLLDFAHQNESQMQCTDLNHLVADTVTLMQHQAQNAHVQVQVHLSPEVHPISLDIYQIKQVLLNLIQNAIQAMPNGGALEVTTALEEADGQPGVTISISDTGEGIPPDNLERIFDPFFTTRPVGEGTGLGLSISYGLVTRHGGHISVESQVSQGTTFFVWLPVRKVAHA